MDNKSSNTQQALWLALSSFSSLALGFVSAAILSRYFNKTEYGTYRQILYVYFTLQTIFTFGLPSVFSYFIPRYSYEEGKYFLNKINKIFVLLGLLFSIALYVSSDFIAQILKNAELAIGLKVFSVFPLFTLPALGVEGLYTALKKTKYIAIYNTISKLLMLACIIIPVVYLKGDYKTAIIGWGVASFIIFLYAMYMKSKPYFKVSSQPIVKFYSTVFNYSLPLMAASLVGFFIASSNQFFISRYYGTERFAEFSNGFISLPMIGMVTGSIKAVLLPVFSKAQKENNLLSALKSYENAVLKSVILIYPLILFCIAFATDIVVFVYGDLYKDSAPYFRVSLIRDIFDVLPYLAVLLATGHPKIYYKGHLVMALVLLSFSFLFAKLSFPPITIVSLFVCLDIMLRVYFLFFIYKREQMNLIPFNLIKKIIVIFAHISIVVAATFILAKLILPPNLPLIIKLTINLAFFYAVILMSQRIVRFSYLSPILDLIKRRK